MCQMPRALLKVDPANLTDREWPPWLSLCKANKLLSRFKLLSKRKSYKHFRACKDPWALDSKQVHKRLKRR